MKTIQHIESQLRQSHQRGIDIFAKSEFDKVTLTSMLTAAYLAGHADATAEALNCKWEAPQTASR